MQKKMNRQKTSTNNSSCCPLCWCLIEITVRGMAIRASRLAFVCTPAVHRCCSYQIAVGQSLRQSLPVNFLVAGILPPSIGLVSINWTVQVRPRASHSHASISAAQSFLKLGSHSWVREKTPSYVTAAAQHINTPENTGGRYNAA